MGSSAVVYIRCYPERAPDQEDATGSATSMTRPDLSFHRRQWRVSLTVNGHENGMALLRDPFTLQEYEYVLDPYLRKSDGPRPHLGHDDEDEDEDEEDGDKGDDGSCPMEDVCVESESRIAAYAAELWGQIEAEIGLGASGASDCQLYVVEHYDRTTQGATVAGIHCLAWELLEAWTQQPQLRVTRVGDFPEQRGPLYSVPQPLAAVHGDRSASFRILLVLVRDLSRAGTEHDAPPHLAQYHLMRLHKKLRDRMLLEVVRPGSLEALVAHLRLRELQGVFFHLVHFDLHGIIMPDQKGTLVPWLQFAKRYDPKSDPADFVPRTRLVRVETVARLLARHKIENVVLNSCLSAYNRRLSSTNMAYVLMRHGIRNVSAMWYYVLTQTVSTYLETFYRELLVRRGDFHTAAQRGRAEVRRKPTTREGREHHDFFVCVSYSRGAHSTEGAMSQDESQRSGYSNGSSLSNMTDSLTTMANGGGEGSQVGVWEPSPPKLSEGLAFPPRQPIQMQLQLLELEFKLATFHVVYATDLLRPRADLGRAMDGMVDMWLATNMIEDVLHYQGKDLARRPAAGILAEHEQRLTRESAGVGAGAGFRPRALRRHVRSPRVVRPLRKTLHVVRGLDDIVGPGGGLLSGGRARLRERRRRTAEARLKALAARVRASSGGGRSYLLIVGSESYQWWLSHMERLVNGEWWLYMSWAITLEGRYMVGQRLPDEGRRLLSKSPGPEARWWC